MQERFMPRNSLTTKTYRVLNGKKVFFYANATSVYQSKWICVDIIGSKAINSISKQGMQHNCEQHKYSN